ncbi:RDD family protein [Tessaracoccus sp. OH4464_COT-324]|uniref:RDD family protein n=1 Tax=Tessaracoccus sp. OH4464_COT-324 TaxID=2491059 RepID=UPI000F63C2B1|nr:RDD family protein [Tessaracoccus sp. OH4464_COT-324]RRD45218.1 RDD family protein [Tessaracoccus sp. OH4464_COT-324]
MEYPGSFLGLPETGRGSLASWGSRIGALLIDWLASMIVALLIFGTDVLWGSGWRSFMILAVFFVQSAVLTTVAGGSFGQLLSGVGVVRVDGGPLGLWRPALRCAVKCLGLPLMVIGAERRHLVDMLFGTVVVRRR